MTAWLLRMVEERAHRDSDDRPLREIRTPPEHLRPDDIQHKSCPYAGARFEHALPMNVSALRQTSAHWADVVDALALVRQLHAAQRGAGPPDLMDVWRVSQLAASLPWFFILRGDAGARAPGFAAALAKATQGVGLWAQRVLVDAIAGARPAPAMTAAAILASAEDTGTLIGELEVCAGSEAMMRRFCEVLIAGEPTLERPSVRELADAGADVLRFGAHYAGFKLLLWLHALARQFVYADLIAALGPDHARAADVRALIAGGCDPSDFVLIGPPEPAAVPLAARAAWLAGLASLVVPIAPDGSDRALRVAAVAIAHACGQDPTGSALVDEVAAVADLAPTAFGGLGVGFALGLGRGSWGTMAYAVAGGVIWHLVARPMEERDLAARFGASYQAYRAVVRCWWPRLRPYRAR